MRGYDLKKVPFVICQPISLLPFKHNLVGTLGFAKMFRKMANNKPSDSVTKVHQAARDGTADLTDLLKRLNTDERKTALETKTKHGNHITTPLIIAARNGNLDSVKILLRYKADIEARGTLKDTDGNVVEGCTPLWAAVDCGHLDFVELLIKRNALVDGRTLSNATPLSAAAYDGPLDIVSCLVKHGADVNARDDDGTTPLIETCCNGHVNVATYLVEHGANIHLQDEDGDTCLHYAAEGGHIKVASKLLAVGAKENQDYVNARNNFGSTPLMVTCYNGHMNVATYLVEHGAKIHLQDKDGNTCLHYAAERGHVEVASKLLCLGAKEKQNYQRLTPLLVARNHCNIEMVEYFIKRPECTKEQRIDALELLGATIANDLDGYDIEKAFSYMKRGMEERYEDPSHPLLKKKMEPVEAYQNRKESQTLEELALLEGDDHAIHMEGLIIRERILGTDNTELLFDIRYRGRVFAASDQYDLCCGLWRRSMEIAVNCDDPVTNDLDNFAHVFGVMVQKGRLLRPKCIQDVFEKLVTACERQKRKETEKSKSGKLQEEHNNEEEAKMLFYALYLLMIYAKVQVPNENETVDMTDFVQRFLRLNPLTRDGETLLHLAAWHETPINIRNYEPEKVRSVYKLPCVETMKLILHAGCDVNAVNSKGNTPLHLAVTFKPGPGQVEILKEMLELLLDVGADTKLANSNGQTAVDYCETDEARRILSEKRGLDAVNIDAKAVRKF